MACELPIIASKVNGIPDLLKEGAWSCGSLVSAGDPSAVVEAMERLLSDRGMARELGQRAYIRARDNFSMEAVGRQLSSVFSSQRN
jgi:glycosyltransferase involved in cell wall biosynthesis